MQSLVAVLFACSLLASVSQATDHWSASYDFLNSTSSAVLVNNTMMCTTQYGKLVRIEYEGEPSYCLAYDCEYTAFKKLWTNKTCDSNEEPPIVSLTPPVGFAMEVGYSGSSSCASAAASRVNLYALDVCIPRANSPAQLPYKRYSCGSNAFLETHFATADCSDTGTLDKSLATGCAMKEGDYRHVVCGPAGATSTASSVTAASQAVIAVLILLASI